MRERVTEIERELVVLLYNRDLVNIKVEMEKDGEQEEMDMDMVLPEGLRISPLLLVPHCLDTRTHKHNTLLLLLVQSLIQVCTHIPPALSPCLSRSLPLLQYILIYICNRHHPNWAIPMLMLTQQSPLLLLLSLPLPISLMHILPPQYLSLYLLLLLSLLLPLLLPLPLSLHLPIIIIIIIIIPNQAERVRDMHSNIRHTGQFKDKDRENMNNMTMTMTIIDIKS
jgi:hypothetical protein